jgi:phosphate transport system ATP-binding protein
MIEIKNLKINISGKTILHSLSMRIPSPGLTSIVGPSGSGKSTLLLALNRLHDLNQNVQVSGEIIMEGRNILERGTDVLGLRKKIGLVLQRPSPFPISIFENVALPLREHFRLKGEALKAQVDSRLHEVGLYDEVSDRLKDSALELSLGQQQRLCLARTLSLNPQVILLDEPCSSLDDVSSQIIEAHLVTLKKTKTIILVTHDHDQAQRLSNQIIFLAKGSLRSQTNTHTTQHHPPMN